MKNKLIHYLSKEVESLKGILAQAEEIKRLIDADEIQSAVKLLSEREQNIEKANKVQEEVLILLSRISEAVLKNGEVVALRESIVNILKDINKVDVEINGILLKKHANSQEDVKSIKEARLIKKGYTAINVGSISKLLDKKF